VNALSRALRSVEDPVNARLAPIAIGLIPLLGCVGAQESAPTPEPVSVSQACGPQQDGPCTYFDDQGRKTLDVSYAGGKLAGDWIGYFPSGKLASKGAYAGGERTGTWTTFHANGEKATEGPYAKGLRDGEWMQYDAAGQLLSKQNITGGAADSYAVYGAAGAVEETVALVSDKVRWSRLVSRGASDIEVSYDAEGRRDGVFRAYFSASDAIGGTVQGGHCAPNCTKVMSEHRFKAGQRDGVQSDWFANGQLRSESLWLAGKKNGKWTTFHANAKVATVSHYDHGKRTGEWGTFFESGGPTSVSAYVASTRDGTWTRWGANGNKLSVEIYDNGLRTGTWQTWHPDGQLATEGAWSANRTHGVHKAYFANGGPKSEQSFVNGTPDGPSTTWHDTGAKKSLDTYTDGAKNGPASAWSKSGQLLSQGAFAADAKSGTWTAYHKSGRKASQTSYTAGLATGAFTAWYDQEDAQKRIHGSYTVTGGASAASGKWMTWYADGGKATELDQGAGLAKLYEPGGQPLFDLSATPDGWIDARLSVDVKGGFKDASPQGEWVISAVGGRKMESITFKNGLRDGEAHRWHANGTKSTVGAYAGGSAVGAWMRWNNRGKLLDVTCYDGGGMRHWTSFEPIGKDVSCP
jgi:antitoxin component YwqK of YwqJK toxin-antitoxin module